MQGRSCDYLAMLPMCLVRHCEEQSDEAISQLYMDEIATLRSQ